MKNKHIIKVNQRGSFLVELMIGLLMSIFSVLGVMTIYSQFEGQKRTTTQTGQALTNAALGLFPIQHNGKMAGYGLNNTVALGCTVRAFNDGVGEYSFTLTPVSITFGASNSDSDELSFLIGDSSNYFAPAKLTQAMPNPSAVYKVDTRFGFKEGDLLIAAEPGKDCTLAQVTNLPGTPGNSDNVIHNSGNYTDPVTGTNKPATFNKPGGLGVSYGTNARLFNIGAAPSLFTYSINGNQLVQTNLISGNAEETIVGDNIVLLQAAYGVDENDDGAVELWTRNPLTQAQLNRVTAVRVAIIARSALRERSEGGVCNITANSDINWLNGTFDISALPDWQCYRYRLLQTTVPMKNMLWRNNT